MSETWLTLTQVAKDWQMSRDELRAFVEAGKFESVKKGRGYRINVDSFSAWMANENPEPVKANVGAVSDVEAIREEVAMMADQLAKEQAARREAEIKAAEFEKKLSEQNNNTAIATRQDLFPLALAMKRNQTLIADKATVLLDLADAQRQLEAEQAANKRTGELLSEVREKNSELCREIERLRANIDEASTENGRLQEELSKGKDIASTMFGEIKKLKRALAESENALRVAESDIEKTSALYNQEKGKRTALQHKLEKAMLQEPQRGPVRVRGLV